MRQLSRTRKQIYFLAFHYEFNSGYYNCKSSQFLFVCFSCQSPLTFNSICILTEKIQNTERPDHRFLRQRGQNDLSGFRNILFISGSHLEFIIQQKNVITNEACDSFINSIVFKIPQINAIHFLKMKIYISDIERCLRHIAK